jgi:hypothetical protein
MEVPPPGASVSVIRGVADAIGTRSAATTAATAIPCANRR